MYVFICVRTEDQIYKQPMYYALGHFSKFLPANSLRIHHEVTNEKGLAPVQGLGVLSCLRPDNSVALIILNRYARNYKIDNFDLPHIYITTLHN
jgi:glucosylceramidase